MSKRDDVTRKRARSKRSLLASLDARIVRCKLCGAQTFPPRPHDCAALRRREQQ